MYRITDNVQYKRDTIKSILILRGLYPVYPSTNDLEYPDTSRIYRQICSNGLNFGGK